MPQHDYLLLLDDDHKAGANGNTNSQNYIDFGVTTPSAGENPSLTYVRAGNKIGVHLVVTQAYTALNSGMTIRVYHKADGTTSMTLRDEFLFTRAQLNVLGAHYFLPLRPGTLLRYAKLQHIPVSQNGTLGKIQTWFGPGADGAE